MKAHKKLIIITVLYVACVGILAACFFFSRNRTPEFTPDPPQSETPSTWEESRGYAGGSGGTSNSAVSGTSSEEYPKVTQDADGTVGIEFTSPGEKLKPGAPKPPKTDVDNTNPSAPPTYSSQQTKPPAKKHENSSKPAVGSKNGNGAVYDPVFGWIVPGGASQIITDNKGDPNKQVGEMGP